MIVVMRSDATKEQIEKVLERVQTAGLKGHLSQGEEP